MTALPDGTVTFLFSDVEGSTQLLERHGQAMGTALARHHELLHQIISQHRGTVFETVGDAVYAAFARPPDAVASALESQRALAEEDWGPIGRLAVRIALHTGAVERRRDHYFGPALFRCARLQALGYGEQTLLTAVTAALVADALPPLASLRDLGDHRLKDLAEPEHVFQLDHPETRANFPPLRSLDARPHNLPTQLSSFVGREDELEDLGRLLSEHRLVTLVGPSGVGKTRLALQAAADNLDAMPDGVFFVDLAPLRNAHLIPTTIAAALGLLERRQQPSNDVVAAFLRDRQLLLVLDNCEQLLPEAAQLIADLFINAPQLHLLATSRAPLRVSGEQEYAVRPLSAGSPDQLDPVLPPAVALFLDRARDVDRQVRITQETGPLISAICESLDGLPLAIELAAARLRLLSLPELRDRLAHRLPVLTAGPRDRPARQRTMRAAVAWSVELLSSQERRCFARLGVFSGSFAMAAVEAVVGSVLGAAAIEALSALVEHNLVRRVEGDMRDSRYAMLETIREYALEQLGDDTAAARQAHLDFFAGLCAKAPDALEGHDQLEWLGRLDADLDNVRAALAFAMESRVVDVGVKLVTDLRFYWGARSLRREAISWLSDMLGIPGATPATRAAGLNALGARLQELGETARARRALEEALAIRRSLGSRRDTSRTLNNLANVAWLEGDFDASEKLLAEAIDLALDLDDRYAVAAGHLNLGGMLLDAGHVDRAADQLQLALTEFEALGDSIHTAWVRTRLAWVGLAQEKLDLAQRHLQAARSTFNASQTPEYEIEILIGEAALALRRRQFGRAQRRIAAAMDPRYESVAYDVPATIELLAAVAASLGRPEVSAFLWGASASESRRSNWRRTGWAYRWRPEYRNLARKALGDSRFRRALVAGASADWSEVLLTAHKGIASLGRLLGSVKPGNEVSSRPQRNRDRSLTMQEL